MKLTRHFSQLWHKRTKTQNSLHAYLCFSLLRIIFVFIPQTGYIHPDEFFQSTEVITGDHFRLEHTRTWEFNNTSPVRSITLPFLLLRIPYSFLEFFAIYLRQWLDINIICTYTYLVFPRCIYCLISFINDYCMYRLCKFYSLHFEIRLLALSSSWIMLTFATRTFSNTLELTFCSMLLCLVAECMLKTNTIVYKTEYLNMKYVQAESIGERVKIWKLKNALPAHNFNYLIAMSSICVAGVFNRPTFLFFGAPMVFFWLLRGMGTRTITFKDFNLRILLFCLSALPTLAIFIFCDSVYYKYLTVGELQMLQLSIKNFVFTPWNFIKYNMDAKKTAEHGLHARYLHVLVNIPLLYNVLGIITVIAFLHLVLRFLRAEYQLLPRSQSIVGLMVSAIFVPLFFLSLINHQEPRFLIPLTFPIILLHAPKLLSGFCATYPFQMKHSLQLWLYQHVLSMQASARYILRIWYILNLALTIFYGFIHQAGVYPLAQHMSMSIMASKPAGTHVHLITSHTYSLPLHLVNVPSSKVLHFNMQTHQRYRRQRDFFYYEYGSINLNALLHKIKLIVSNCELKSNSPKHIRYKLYLAIPTSLSDELAYVLQRSNVTYMNFELQRIFYPHLSTEAFPRLYGRHPCDVHPPHWSQDDLRGTCDLEQLPTLSYNYLLRQFSSFMHQFGLALYEVEVQRKVRPVTISVQKNVDAAATNKKSESLM